MCGYFLNVTSESPVMMSGYLINSNTSEPGEALLTRTLPLTTLVTREPLYGNGSINFKHLRNTIMDVLIVASSDGTAGSVYQKTLPLAQECVLSWCVQTIKSSYDWGKYDEVVLETLYNTSTGDFPWVSEYVMTETENYTNIFYTEDINIEVPARLGGNSSTYGTSNSTASAILQGFTDVFPSFTTSLDHETPSVMRYKIWNEGPAWNRYLDYNPWLYRNVSRHMERLATAMTSVVRSAASKEMLAGQAFSRETYVSVRWEWLTLPLGLLSLGFIFLAATIFKSAIEKDQVGVLKNSAILTLLYGLPEDMRRRLTRSSSTGTPRAKAKELKVKLNPNMGWRVSGNIFTPITPRKPQPQPPPGWI